MPLGTLKMILKQVTKVSSNSFITLKTERTKQMSKNSSIISKVSSAESIGPNANELQEEQKVAAASSNPMTGGQIDVSIATGYPSQDENLISSPQTIVSISTQKSDSAFSGEGGTSSSSVDMTTTPSAASNRFSALTASNGTTSNMLEANSTASTAFNKIDSNSTALTTPSSTTAFVSKKIGDMNEFTLSCTSEGVRGSLHHLSKGKRREEYFQFCEWTN